MFRCCNRVAVLLACLGSIASLGAQTSASPSSSPPIVYVAEVDSIIHPVSAEYMIETINKAELAGAALIVFTLRTPGGLVDSTRTIVERMVASRTPVAVYVAPSGGRAASAGFLITIAADVAAMAPGTHIGAAHPVTGGGEKMDETTSRKAAEDVAAMARTLAAQRRRNVSLAEEAVIKSRAFTDQEALKASPPLIDLVATSVDDLLRQLDGRTITRFHGGTLVLETSGPTLVPIQMNWRQRFLSAIAHPQVAYILFSLGTLGLTIELWNPGAVVPGVVGGLCLLLAFFAFQVLPVNYAGLLLILFGLLLLVLEVKVASFGLLGIGGIVSLILGALIMIDAPNPELQVGLRVILPVSLGLAGILLLLVKLAVSAQRAPAVTGQAGMLNARGVALTDIRAGGTGRVSTRGETWTATAPEPVAKGAAVRVTDVKGLVLVVRPTGESAGVEGVFPTA